MRKAESVANYIIAYGMQIGHPVSNLQLQKILYYIQVHFLKETGTSFFKDDIEAWQFGPVVPRVYFRYATFGPAPITMFHVSKKDWTPGEEAELNQIIKEKVVLSPWDMVEDTHQKGKPWQRCYEPNARNIISKEEMKLYG